MLLKCAIEIKLPCLNLQPVSQSQGHREHCRSVRASITAPQQLLARHYITLQRKPSAWSFEKSNHTCNRFTGIVETHCDLTLNKLPRQCHFVLCAPLPVCGVCVSERSTTCTTITEVVCGNLNLRLQIPPTMLITQKNTKHTSKSKF